MNCLVFYLKTLENRQKNKNNSWPFSFRWSIGPGHLPDANRDLDQGQPVRRRLHRTLGPVPRGFVVADIVGRTDQVTKSPIFKALPSRRQVD